MFPGAVMLPIRVSQPLESMMKALWQKQLRDRLPCSRVRLSSKAVLSCTLGLLEFDEQQRDAVDEAHQVAAAAVHVA